jgi:hypothetical protein
MIPHHLYDPLVILGLLGLFLMLHVAWPSPSATIQPRPAQPIKSRRTRSNEPTPFAGLTQKPHGSVTKRLLYIPIPEPLCVQDVHRGEMAP